MKITLNNLGVFKHAEFSLADLTIICGKNNCGKTYATYALFGFIDFLQQGYRIQIPDNEVIELINNGSLNINIDASPEYINRKLKEACEEFKQFFPKIFSGQSSSFSDTSIEIQIDASEISTKQKYENKYKINQKDYLQIYKEINDNNLKVTYVSNSGNPMKNEASFRLFLKDLIGDVLKDILFNDIFPQCFLSSTERTGAVMFKDELAFQKNSILRKVMSKDEVDLRGILDIMYDIAYPLPIRRNVDFIRNLESVSKTESPLRKEHPEILKKFSEISGGSYKVQKDSIYFVPKGASKLTMNESASAVKSLLDIYFYLNHVARPGQLLIIDEPEMNLHPENQRKIARIIARLINVGIKVFVTTHSDYFVKELNTLLMFDNLKKNKEEICDDLMKKYKYDAGELISINQIKVFISKKDSILLPGNLRKTKQQILAEAKIDERFGIQAKSFDDTINEMNNIQETIIFL